MDNQPINAPPPQLEKVIANLLPPSRREQVVGDLAERFAERAEVGSVPRPNASKRSPVWGPDLLHYIGDALMTVPMVIYSTARRSLAAGSSSERLAGFASSTVIGKDLQRQAEQFQDRIWHRNLREFISAGVLLICGLIFALSGKQVQSQIAGVLDVAAMLYISRVLYTRGSSKPVPRNASDLQLLMFHREELLRQHDLLRGIASWYIAPLLPAMGTMMLGHLNRPLASVGHFVFLLLVTMMLAAIWAVNRHAAGKLQRAAHELDSPPEAQVTTLHL